MKMMNQIAYKAQDGSTIDGPLDDEKALLILPKIGGHGIYTILREQGAEIEEALLCVLHLQCGEEELANPILTKHGLA